MAVREVGATEFYELSRRRQGKLLVAKFTSTGSVLCRSIAPHLEALARRMSDVEFVKVYEHNCRDVMISLGIRSFPTYHFYSQGSKVDECRGASMGIVKHKVELHRGSGSVSNEPVVIKLRFLREKTGGSSEERPSEEVELEVQPAEGLEIFKFQVLSLTDVDPKDQVLTSGADDSPVDNDKSLVEALSTTGGGTYGNYPVIKVSKRVRGEGFKPGTPERSIDGVAANKPDDVTTSWQECCSRIFFGREAVKQPAYVLHVERHPRRPTPPRERSPRGGPGSIFVVCKACAENCFVPGRVILSPGISECAAFVCQSKDACAKGHGSDLFSQRADIGSEVYPSGSQALAAAKAAAAAAAEGFAAKPLVETREMVSMRQKIEAGAKVVFSYEDPEVQAKARAALSSALGEGTIQKRGRVIAAEGGYSEEEGRARALLSWFKKEFFKWTNKPPCSKCGATGRSVISRGLSKPTVTESAGKASRVEVYQCTDCDAMTRFPRYNDPIKLLETRNGRCGEWANCFTMLCRAVELEARHVMDWTDHVWTEIWIPQKRRWVHADPCENKLDKPRMYEEGWGKRLSYIVAYDRDGAMDVTRRYTRRWLQVLSRRVLVPEAWLASVVHGVRACRPTERMTSITARLAEEQEELKRYETMGPDDDSLDGEDMEGRRTGDAAWIAARGEDGGGYSSRDSVAVASTSLRGAVSPLLGSPLGHVQEGGALALSLAAIVADTGRGVGASIFVGGVLVSKAQGSRAVCAAVVSGTRGILLDSRCFFLREGNEAGEISAWVAEIPQDSVVVFAGTGRINESSREGASIHWVNAVRMLVSGSSGLPQPADNSAQEGPSWVLVGWKGRGRQEWTRRENSSAGRGTRCGLYLELLKSGSQQEDMGSPVPKPTHVKLDNKICVTPLRSVSSEASPMTGEVVSGSTPKVDDGELPLQVASLFKGEAQVGVSGACFGLQQPMVAIGSEIELDHREGWTTVLRVPAEDHASSVTGKEGTHEFFSSWRAAMVSSAVGGWHEDTESFDDTAVGCPAFVMGGSPVPLSGHQTFLPVARVREVVCWSRFLVNGVQVVYEVGGALVRASMHLGEHGFYRQSSLVLDIEAGEVITEISVVTGTLVDSLHIKTNLGQEKSWGGKGGGTRRTWHVPIGYSFVGFHGGFGGHLHSLGVVLAQTGGQAENAGSEAATLAVPGSSCIIKQWVPSRNILSNLYSPDPVRRACAKLMALNKTPGASESEDAEACEKSVVVALETAVKYADNILASPSDPRVSRIRLGNKFFDRNIGRLSGGGGVMRALGFRLNENGGRMQYVFDDEKTPLGDGLGGLKRSRQTLVDVLTALKRAQSMRV